MCDSRFLSSETRRASNSAPTSCSAIWVAIALEPGENQKVSIGVSPIQNAAKGRACDGPIWHFPCRRERWRSSGPGALPLGGDFRETNGMNDALAPDALALHRALVTLDTHIDIPWPPGPEPFQEGPRKVDMPKMQRGGMSAGCFVAYVPQAARTPASEDAAFARAVAMLDHINAMGRTENGITARVTPSAAAVEAAKRDGVLAIVPCVENGFAIGTDLSRLAVVSLSRRAVSDADPQRPQRAGG